MMLVFTPLTKDENDVIVILAGGIICTSDLINLIPVIGSCKLAYETVQAAFKGNGKMALRKAVQCSISLVADFYL